MTDEAQSIAPVAVSGSRKMNIPILIAIAAVAAALFVYIEFGLYSIQPIGALPDGSTTLVWRADGEPFFNSPDAACLQRIGSVSLLCRAMAMGQAPIDRIILRLPYQAWAYHYSTGGQDFSS